LTSRVSIILLKGLSSIELFRYIIIFGAYFTGKLIETIQPPSALWFLFLMINYSLFPVDVFCLYFLIFFDWLDLGNCMPSCIDTYPHVSEMTSISVLPLGYSYNVCRV
jgi:hypothetical protein